MDAALRKLLLKYQKIENTGHVIYNRMAFREKNAENKKILMRMAIEEREHARILQHYTGEDPQADRLQVWWYSFLGWLFGYTFVIRLMENGETLTIKEYTALVDQIPEFARIIQEEEIHEEKLMGMLDEERLQYVGAMVLGLNDALVELTGTIAGLTFALEHTRIVALAGIITGVSATLSMAASNYLAERADGNPNAFKSSLYTGFAYLVTVVLLVLPYLTYPEDMYFEALATMLVIVILIIFVFNYYVAVAKNLPFMKRFGEMACISLGVAVISFAIGLLAKNFLDIDL